MSIAYRVLAAANCANIIEGNLLMAHSYDAIYLHFVFAVKERHHLLSAEHRPGLFRYIGGIAKRKKCSLIIGGGVADHVHLLMRLHRMTCPGLLMDAVKANSSRWLQNLARSTATFEWRTGYSVFSVGHYDFERARSYIKNQEQHHLGMTHEDELERMEREYDRLKSPLP